MSCRISILKAVLGILNAVLSILGVVLIALSVYELNSSTPGTIEHIAIVVQIFIGSFVILTSFLGCFGTCRESLGLTWSFAICVLILMAFQIYIIIATHSTDYARNASDHFDALWQNYTLNAASIEAVEQKYNCCGKLGAKDYIILGKGSHPKSCFLNFDKAPERLFSAGCFFAVQENAARNGTTGLMIKWILFFIELITLAFAGFLGITIRNKQRRLQFRNYK